MQSEEHIVAALRALAEEDAELEAPLRVEDRVRKAFRRKHVARKWRNGLTWSLALAAAVIVVVFIGMRDKQHSPPPRAKEVATRPPQLAVVDHISDPQPVEIPPASVPARQVRRIAPKSDPQPREVVTEFFPLLDVAPPFERGELLRVTVPASTMRKVGLPVNENRLADRVYADVLVGNEGLARAIRFVSYEQ
jgi:hypothetical protein